MKSKPGSHKSQNTFRFQTFSERIAGINIDVIHRIAHVSDVPEEGDTFFNDTLKKSAELNCTAQFDKFKEELGGDVSTLPQLVLCQAKVIKCLQRHLQVPGNLALQPLLQLVVALAKDLQFDFYPHYPQFFRTILKILNAKDAEVLEWSFTCLSYLFKFLWRYMVKDIENVFQLYAPLFGAHNPIHVRNFAAESFAFLLRKVPNKYAAFKFIFLHLKQEPKQSAGVGQLLFEVMKGVKKQFHSCTSQVLPVLLSLLGSALDDDDEDLPWAEVLVAQLQMTNSMTNHTERCYMAPVWDSVTMCVNMLYKKTQLRDELSRLAGAEHLGRVLQVMEILINFQNCALVQRPEKIVEVQVLLLRQGNLSEDTYVVLLQMICSILLHCSSNLQMAQISSLISSIFNSDISYEVVFGFVQEMFPYGMFEKDVLSHILNYCERILSEHPVESRQDVLALLAKIVLHFRPPPVTGDCLGRWKTFSLDLDNPKLTKKSAVLSLIESVLKTEVDSTSMCMIWASCVIIPHVRGLKKQNIASLLHDLELKSTRLIQEDEAVSDKLPFMLYYIILSLLRLETQDEFFKNISDEWVTSSLSHYPTDVFLLQMIDIVISHAENAQDNRFHSDNFLSSAYALLENNLSSPHHEVRLLSLRILATLQPTVANCNNKNVVEDSIFTICLAAENTKSDVHTYREKLKYLQKLDCSLVQSCLPRGKSTQVALRYLLGALYVNFQLLWDPILRLIETHAQGLSAADFWEVYSFRLHEVVNQIVLQPNDASVLKHPSANWVSFDAGHHNMLRSFFEKSSVPLTERVDHINYRILLWRGMQNFSGIAEAKNREVSTLFLKYLEKEYYQADVSAAPSQNIQQKNLEGTMVESEEDDVEKAGCEKDDSGIAENDIVSDDELDKNYTFKDSDDEDSKYDENQMASVNREESKVGAIKAECSEDLDEAEELPLKKLRRTKSEAKVFQKQPSTMKTFLAHVAVVAKFRNPKAAFREPELKELMLKFLSHRNPAVQKYALDFLMAYNDKALIPYKDNFYNLLNDKTFKTEITSFNIDVQSKIIQEEHRGMVLPVLIRILYGKMQSKTGRNTSGKGNSNLRRSIVLRFLAGSQEAELEVFLKLAFQSYESVLDGNVLEVVRNVKSQVNAANVIPIKQLQASLNLLSIIFSKLGNLITHHLPWLLKLLLCITAMLAQLLHLRSTIQPQYINLIKDLRISAILRLAHFFDLFDTYPFSPEEIDAIFESAVWPQLQRLHFESLYSPTALLKMVFKWSCNPRYFILLSKQQADDELMIPLSQIMELFIATKTRPAVVNLILDMLENLLTLADEETMDVDGEDEPTRKGLPLTINGASAPIKQIYSHPEDSPNFGTLLLLGHIPKILDRLKRIVSKVVKSSRRLLPDKILTILTRTSEYITDPELATDMVNLLLPFLAKKTSYPEGMELSILKTVANLIKYAAKPDCFIRTIAKLFSHLQHRNTRVALCDILSAIAARNESVMAAAIIVAKINAWDARWMEEPDYAARLDGFRSASNFLNTMKTMDIDFILLVTFNCCYFVSETNDLSLRESAAYFLQQLIKSLSACYDSEKENCSHVLYAIMLPEIKKGLRSKNEATRHEFLVVLATVVESFPNLPKLSDLHLLKDTDAEVDFFENIRHIQIHRRARALTRVARSEHIKSFHEDTLLQYLMPVASSFLFNDGYAKHPNLVDAAIELLASICRNISWYQYENTLRHYLNILPKNNDYPKMTVKVVVAVLDAFHFDLTRSEGLQEAPLNQNQALELSEEMTPKEVATATKIHKNIAKGILPQLHKCLTKKTRSESEHKLTRHEYPEDEEILRVPIALAMVKLLQHLPKGSLEQNLPGLFLKLCTLLKSRADSIREMTRDTVVKIMESLGPKYFPYLLKQMRQTMTKGYQVHVMIFTLHSVLHRLTAKLAEGDLDSCLPSLLQVCHEELFGQVGEEKEVAQIVGKLKEARGNKSYSMYEIIAKYVSENQLLGLVKPIRDVLATTYKHQAVRKAQECLQNAVLGLSENKAISTKCLLIFVHGLVSESIPELTQERKKKGVASIPKHLVRVDSYLLASEPARGGGTSKTSSKTNAHILIEFGLQLLHFGLKREKISSRDQEHLQMLDPFIPILVECLNSQYVKLISSSLRCLNWLLKFPLPSLKQHIHRLSSALFVLLNKYGTTGAGQGDNFEMVVMAFKVVTVLVRDIDYHTITSGQLRVLLTYAEQDIVDHTRQATAFSLLRAILSRKLVADEIDDVMRKVGEMCVSSDVEHIRIQCRQVFLQFLIDYPLGKKLKQHLEFFVAQLSFAHEYGRLSALEMLSTVITTFPQPMLKKHSGLLFVPLSTCLVNDDSPTCRKLTSQIIKTLLQKLDASDRNLLFGAVLAWLQDNKMRHRRLAAQLCGIFVEADGDGFSQHLEKLLPIFIQQLLPDKYVDVKHESVERSADHIVFYILNSLLKIISATDLMKKQQHRPQVNQLFEYVQHHLLHGHTWVRLASCQLFGLLFSHYSATRLAEAALNNEDKDEYLLTATRNKVQTLCQDFLSQFRSPTLESDLADQVVKNLVYMAKVVTSLQLLEAERNCRQPEREDGNESENEGDSTQCPFTIDWLIRKMNREAKFEVANNPKVVVKRSCVFKWIAAVATDIKCEGLSPRLPLILTSLQRELSDNSPQADKDLKVLAGEVVDLVRKMVGTEEFARHYAALQSSLTKKRADRRVQKAQEAVSNPQVAAKRRIKKQVSKKAAQKRKLERLRPTKASKRRRLKDMAVVS